MPDFVIVPRGPFSLARAADVVAHFPPLQHQPRASHDGVVRLGFIADGTHRSVTATLRSANHGAIHVTTSEEGLRAQVERIFSLDHDATGFFRLGDVDPRLAPVLDAHAGLRPVCFTSPYECACWGILSQRITTGQAAKVVAEIVRAHGERVDGIGVFPRPDRLLDIRAVPGLAAVKLGRLHAIAEATLDGKLEVDGLRALGQEAAIAHLLRLPGIGPFWSAAIWYRACGVTDPFPDEPLSLAALEELHDGERPDLAIYRPFGMWLAFLLRVASRRSPARPGGRRAASSMRSAPRGA